MWGDLPLASSPILDRLGRLFSHSVAPAFAGNLGFFSLVGEDGMAAQARPPYDRTKGLGDPRLTARPE